MYLKKHEGFENELVALEAQVTTILGNKKFLIASIFPLLLYDYICTVEHILSEKCHVVDGI